MSWESKVRGTRARFGAQAEPFCRAFPQEQGTLERQTRNVLSLPFQKWPCGLSGAAAVAAAGCREAAARLAEAPCCEMAGPWSRSTAGRPPAAAEGRGRERGGSESWRGTVTREQGAVCG